VTAFARRLQTIVVKTIEDGVMTKDLAAIAEPKVNNYALTREFIDEIAARLKRDRDEKKI
jgi:isocitrate dehydrogenase